MIIFLFYSPLDIVNFANLYTLYTMASAYRSAVRSKKNYDSDDSDSDSSAASSHTVDTDLPDENEKTVKPEKNNDLSQLPAEIRNRVLMLTSRGVSYR